MKWKIPDEGQKRSYVKFAFKPIACTDGYYRWLESVEVTEIYIRGQWRMGQVMPPTPLLVEAPKTIEDDLFDWSPGMNRREVSV